MRDKVSARFQKLHQNSPYDTPWPVRVRLGIALWHLVWLFLFRPSPKPCKGWRLFLLRLFGCRVEGRPFVSPSAIIKMPWNLTLQDHACLGPGSEAYNLAPLTLNARSVVAQQAYLCGGTHDFSDPNLSLVLGEILVGEDAFIGARAFILPGITIGQGAIVGAGSVVTKDVEPWNIVAGNPAKPIGKRELRRTVE